MPRRARRPTPRHSGTWTAEVCARASVPHRVLSTRPSAAPTVSTTERSKWRRARHPSHGPAAAPHGGPDTRRPVRRPDQRRRGRDLGAGPWRRDRIRSRPVAGDAPCWAVTWPASLGGRLRGAAYFHETRRQSRARWAGALTLASRAGAAAVTPRLPPRPARRHRGK